MSNRLYYECVTHNRPIQSDELCHNLGYLKDVFEALDKRDELVALVESQLENFSEMPWSDWDIATKCSRFLYEHPECEIKVIDEYGRYHDNPSKPIPSIWDWVNPHVTPNAVHFKHRSSGAVFLTALDMMKCQDAGRGIGAEIIRSAGDSNLILKIEVSEKGWELSWRPNPRVNYN